MQIPVVDFERFRVGTADERQAIALQMHQTCHEFGFMYLKNVGIPQFLLDELFISSKQFFSLPLADKTKLTTSRQINEALRGGYVGLGREHEDADLPSDIKVQVAHPSILLFWQENIYEQDCD